MLEAVEGVLSFGLSKFPSWRFSRYNSTPRMYVRIFTWTELEAHFLVSSARLCRQFHSLQHKRESNTTSLDFYESNPCICRKFLTVSKSYKFGVQTIQVHTPFRTRTVTPEEPSSLPNQPDSSRTPIPKYPLRIRRRFLRRARMQQL